MIRRIKLMTDWSAFPLWWDEGENCADFDPHKLPLSEELLDRLAKWANMYEQQMNYNDSYDESRFFNKQEAQAFEQEGMQLWSALRRELGPSYEISYYSQFQGRVLTPSDRES